MESPSSEGSPPIVKSPDNWPVQFVFPTSQLPAKVTEALKNGTDLTLPKRRHLHGLLVNTLCDATVTYKSHPNCYEKQEMARSIITAWPHLREPVARGFYGWLSSIVDCLKAKRRSPGLAVNARSDAQRKCKALRSLTGVEQSLVAVQLPASSQKYHAEIQMDKAGDHVQAR